MAKVQYSGKMDKATLDAATEVSKMEYRSRNAVIELAVKTYCDNALKTHKELIKD